MLLGHRSRGVLVLFVLVLDSVLVHAVAALLEQPPLDPLAIICAPPPDTGSDVARRRVARIGALQVRGGLSFEVALVDKSPITPTLKPSGWRSSSPSSASAMSAWNRRSSCSRVGFS